MKGTVKTLRFFAWPLAQMLGIATLFYFGTLVLDGLTKMVIFSDYAISFCFLYGIFLYISFWQFSAAYSQLALSFGATQLSLWMPMNEPAGRNVFLLQCGLHPVGGFCLMLFLAATGSAAGTALPAAWPRTLCLTAKILLYIVAFAQIFVFMLLAYFCPQWFVPYCAALVVAGCLLMAAALRALRHIAVR